MKRFFLCTLVLCLLCGLAGAEEIIPKKTMPFPKTEGADSKGFLTTPGLEYVLEDPENGLWRYASSTLQVNIIRYTAENIKQVWYVTHIYQATPAGMKTFLSNPENPYGNYIRQYNLARREKVVYATNADFFATRQGDSGPVGVVIRNGVIVARRTSKDPYSIPTRDVLAFFPDGRMKCYEAESHTATDYLNMGVTDTLCFGPILVTDGALNAAQIARVDVAREPRCALGMVEPGHYVSIVCEGRTNTSNGLTLMEMGELMAAEGCTEALNLDGGQTVMLCFMGIKLNETGNAHEGVLARKTTDIVGVGYSELVPEMEGER